MMLKKISKTSAFVIYAMFALCLLLSGCSKKAINYTDINESGRNTLTKTLCPVASGQSVFIEENVSIDISNTSQGYVMVKYNGDTDDIIKIQIKTPLDDIYTYTLQNGDFEAFSLSHGNGNYCINVLKEYPGTMYRLICSCETEVIISDEFLPFLYPSQYCWFTDNSLAVSIGRELSDTSPDDLTFVSKVYHYVITNIIYDDLKADSMEAGYIPDIDKVLDDGKGICFDYASLMSSMLRSQGIPTKIEVGYIGAKYHAWISVYIEDIGWIDNIISFNGIDWTLLDPTLAANNDPDLVAEFVTDETHYTLKYQY